MSPLMILLLILILMIRSSYPSAIKTDTKERIYDFHDKNHKNPSIFDRLNYTTIKVMKNNHDLKTLKSNKLRHDLLHVMSAMIKRIIKERRTNNNNNLEKITNENKISIDEFPIENDLERAEEIERNENDYKTVIDSKKGKISEVSEIFMPLVRRFSSSRIRKVRGSSSRLKKRINDFNGNERRTSSRGKRQSETDVWIKRDFEDQDTRMKMHALVVRDEDVPPCCSPAKQITNQRYFMCSGAVLTLKHTITTASCLHFADVYEHNVDADLAILVGATDPRAYVIKVQRYEMHPDYEYDVESKNHPTNNLAMIYLTCSIVAEDVIVPSLPKGINDDIGHMCCRDGCDVITIVESPDNRHIARIIKARNLPAPRHEDDVPDNRQFSNIPEMEIPQFINNQYRRNENFSIARRIGRSPLKLAAAPTFFGKEYQASRNDRISERPAGKRRRKAKMVETSRAKNEQLSGKKKKPLNLDDLLAIAKSKGAQIPILRVLEEEGVNVDEQLAAVNWDEIEETMANKFTAENRATMEIFAKDVVDETMRRLELVLGDRTVNGNAKFEGTNGSSIFGKLMTGDEKNKNIESFVKVFTKVVTSLVPPSNVGAIAISEDGSIEESDLENPPSINEECPPLGSPIIVDGMLVGLLAYTCDDVQSWVEWKYVNIVRNIDWIRKQISRKFEPEKKCSGLEISGRSLQEQEKWIYIDKNYSNENFTSFHNDKLEWSREEDDSRRNFDDSRIVETETPRRIFKDSWFARNFQPAVSQQRSDKRIFVNSRNQAKSSVPRHVTTYNVNTCYVKEDGSTDCQTSAEFEAR